MNRILAGLAVILMVGSTCFADMFYLRDGQVFRGDVIAENNDYIFLQTNSGYEEKIEKRYIERIARDGEEVYRKPRRNYQMRYAREKWNDDELIIKTGLDFRGLHETSHGNLFVEGTGNIPADSSFNVGSGFSLTGEYVTFPCSYVGLGGGITLQSYRSLSDVFGAFGFTPLYGLVKLRTDPKKKRIYEYLIGQLGYNFFDGDRDYRGHNSNLEGGLYYAAGAGIAFRSVQVELLYSVNNGTARSSGYLYDSQTDQYEYYKETGDITYSKVGLNICFVF